MKTIHSRERAVKKVYIPTVHTKKLIKVKNIQCSWKLNFANLVNRTIINIDKLKVWFGET